MEVGVLSASNRVGTSIREASFLGKEPMIDGERPASLAPAINAESLHPNFICQRIHIFKSD